MAYRTIGIVAALGIAVFANWCIVLLAGDGAMLTYAAELGTWLILPILILVSLWNASAVLAGERSNGAKIWSVVVVVSAAMLIWTAFIFRLFYIGLA